MRTGSSVASLLNPTPLLFLITAVVLLVWPDAMGVTALAVVGAVVLPAALVFMVRSPQVAMIALIAASAVPRIFVDVAGMKARPEHIIGGLMIFTIPFLLKKREQPVRWILADYLLLAYIATIFFSSVFMSVAPGQTAKWAVQQVLAILPYFWLRVLVKDEASFRWAFRALLVVGAVTCAYAILSFYSYIFLGTKFGVEVEQYGAEGGGNIAATYGLQFEANILGAYGAALFTMMLVMYLHERRRWYLVGGIFCGMVTMAVSLSRA